VTSEDVEMKTFEEATVYFRVTYPDAGMHFPGIESFVYIGKNLSDEDREDTWYFQPARDFSKKGSALTEKEKDRPVTCVTREGVDEMLSIAELTVALEGAASRLRSRKDL